MPHPVRELTEQRELDLLSVFATKAAESEGRARPEDQDPVRTCFQRDRDRILHSKSFRRLKHKTQVFIDPEGDHYRTRLTHTLEVAQIARTIARAVRLNEDLTEAIALGHDVGHTPFGHAGERALDEAIIEYRTQNPEVDGPTGFKHYEQSLRIVDHLEGLNLSEETRRGIDGHSKGRKDITAADGEQVSTLEAAVVRISDRIAYLNHDIDDAIRSGIISEIPTQFDSLGTTYSSRIGILVEDVIQLSFDQPAIRVSAGLLATMNDLKEWLFENVYLKYPEIYPDVTKAENLVKALFLHYSSGPNLPEGYVGLRGNVDYVSGMTDRFAVADYKRLVIPNAWAD